MTETQAPPTEPLDDPENPKSVIIRPWPKVVFLWPTLLVSLICWLWQMSSSSAGPEGLTSLGNAWMLVFVLNMLVFAFDFSRVKSVTLLVVVVALVLGLGWADATYDIGAGLKDLIGSIKIAMNTHFYGWMTSFLVVVMVVVLINTRFNYYEMNHREVLHHHGYLGDITRMPTSGLRLHKEITDVFEFILMRSGRLVIYPQRSEHPIVIDNVIGVNKIEERIKDLLSVMAVRVQDR